MTSTKTLKIEIIWTRPQVHPYAMHWLGVFIAFQYWRSKLLSSRKSVKELINNCPQESSGDLNHTCKSFHQFDSINHYCLEGKEIKHVEASSIIKWIFPITRKLNATLTLSWKLIPSISINHFYWGQTLTTTSDNSGYSTYDQGMSTPPINSSKQIY